MAPDGGWAWGDIEVTPRTTIVELILDGNVAAELDTARRSLASVIRSEDTLDNRAITEARAEVARIEQAAVDASRPFTVRSIGYRRWRELCAAHPPAHDGERWNIDTFIPAVLLECCDQFHTSDHVDQAVDVLSSGQIAKLFNACRELNEGADTVPTVRGR